MNGRLVASSHSKVARGMRATRVSRSAITSYLRVTSLSSEPSPNQPPVGTPANVTLLPPAEKLLILTRPSMMPTQVSSASPLRQTKPPFGTNCSLQSASTRVISSGARLRAQIVARRCSVRVWL